MTVKFWIDDILYYAFFDYRFFDYWFFKIDFVSKLIFKNSIQIDRNRFWGSRKSIFIQKDWKKTKTAAKLEHEWHESTKSKNSSHLKGITPKLHFNASRKLKRKTHLLLAVIRAYFKHANSIWFHFYYHSN